MNFNATLFGQLLAFLFFVWFCMKYVWPPMLAALEEREKEIADGLDAASKGMRELDEAETRKAEVMEAAKKDAAEILSQANLRANQVIEDAKGKAQEEADRIKISAEKDVLQSMNKAREGLRSEVAILAVAGAEKLLKAEINKESNAALIEEIAGEL
ncbi:F0F1 ATP synthase subunit B [Gammaproteobacteria bacterium]|jgi:F-type H+-transporting ATPase subunit b|nr:F0F1 ATP synthase subunit B [Gammaproteobacteria bacterium]MDB4816368.1 F0F1 ATP synthase subunit B [Gammaproteobacteria bacterium]MDC0508893.1 F0F1 ATP synthase subunit B [Gammaproteobacteria bacterium]MDC0546219.1 F0F1 ATP synthase subunit B [Gammaproteobacteria bacterium]MDC0577123.1 F0F1 ATP synthase subunit B [Gammaproteobacteria bacterium]